MAKISQFVFIVLTLALLAAIATCSLAPSSYMTEISFVPTWLGTWADANPNFRNFPVFAALAALLFVAWNCFFPVSDIRLPTSAKSFVLISPPGDPASRLSLLSSLSRLRLGCLLVFRPLVLRRAALSFCAAALLGACLEVAQLLLPNRHADPMDILWMTLGAFAGAFGAGFASTLLPARSI